MQVYFDKLRLVGGRSKLRCNIFRLLKTRWFFFFWRNKSKFRGKVRKTYYTCWIEQHLSYIICKNQMYVFWFIIVMTVWSHAFFPEIDCVLLISNHSLIEFYTVQKCQYNSITTNLLSVNFKKYIILETTSIWQTCSQQVNIVDDLLNVNKSIVWTLTLVFTSFAQQYC